MTRYTVLFAVTLLACGDPEPGDNGGGTEDAANNSTNDGQVIDPPGADASTDAPTGPQAVRFVVMGDVGEGNQSQYMVSTAIEQKCAADGCDFVVLLGDNIYDSGVSGVDDPQWQTKFEDPYANLDLPFFVVLGNHDYGGTLFGADTGGMGNEWEKGPYEVMYSDVSDKWNMSDTHYTFTWGNVGFIMLDTNSIMWDNTDHGNQRAWYPTALMELSNVDWIFQAGHHPYMSNGAHGNAGNYESIEVGGIELPNPLPILNGDNVKEFFDEVVCGTIDVSLSGHDHNRQWLNEPTALCGAELIVSGAGAKVKDFEGSNEAHWQDADTPGFMYIEIIGDQLTGQFIDENGQMNYERQITRTP